MNKFFNKLKKSCFWPILCPFSQFWGQKNFFLQNLALSCTTLDDFLALYQHLEKTNHTIPRKRPDRQEDRRFTEGQTDPFSRTLPATGGGLKKKILPKSFCLVLLQKTFFNCYLAAPRPTLGHSQGDSLTNPMLITVFVHIRPEGHREPHNKVGSLSPAKA